MFKYTFTCWNTNSGSQANVSVYTDEGLRAAELKVEKVYRTDNIRLISIEEEFIEISEKK